MPYLFWILAIIVFMLVPVRLGFGGWHWDVHLVAAISLLGMWASTHLHRQIAFRFLPDESQAFLLLAANIFRIFIGVIAVLIVVKTDICSFHAFLTSLLSGYVIYLSAEIWILTRKSH